MKEKIYVFLMGMGLMTILLMVVGIFAIVIMNGFPHFWLKDIYAVKLKDGTTHIGEIHDRQKKMDTGLYEIKIKVGNRKILGQDFIWVNESDIESKTIAKNAVVLERYEWGNAYGFLEDTTLDKVKKIHEDVKRQRETVNEFEKDNLIALTDKISKLNHDIEKKGKTGLADELSAARAKAAENEIKLAELKEKATARELNLKLSNGTVDTVKFFDIVHIYQPDRMGVASKSFLCVYRVFEFLFSDPRESNTEGGIFPAIYGTVMMVLLMSIAVFPLGVLAAVFLHEYAREGIFLSIVRNTIFNLAGVPSIVYGVFGMGFFVYTLGASIDQIFYADYLPSPTFGTGGILWASLTLAVLTLPVVIVASLEGLKAVPRTYREGAYALSATKWEVIKDIVIPSAMPGMLTGLILAISRAAGEVAPLMLTGVVKSAVNLPLDASSPFIHLERKFMHLGFHIYDIGFQSPNVEAARAVVFNTTLVLLIIVFILNLVAIIIRNNLRKKFTGSGV